MLLQPITFRGRRLFFHEGTPIGEGRGVITAVAYSKCCCCLHSLLYGKSSPSGFILREQDYSAALKGFMEKETAPENDPWVFREGRKSVASNVLIPELHTAVQSLSAKSATPQLISALLRAGELESALADSSPGPVQPAQKLTDAVVAGLFQSDSGHDFSRLFRDLSTIPIPDQLSVSPAEGFAYYALHPLDFASMADSVADRSKPAAVIGIRSIGTTLSAIITAALRHKGCDAERITVRPRGHPYDRFTHFTPPQLEWVQGRNLRSADFHVVDEGPGRSGSSFLSVGEALLKAGVAKEHITFLGSRPIDPATLCAREAAVRWQRFRFLWSAPVTYSRFQADTYLGGGNWRNIFLDQPESKWPACWPQMERFKFLSPDRHWFYKFEGFGGYGEEILERAQRLCSYGFGSRVEDAGDGMVRYATVEGDLLNRARPSNRILNRIADYCAFRAREFRVRENGSNQLPQMLAFNLQQEFGGKLNFPADCLNTANPVLSDGRMQPFEWVLRRDGAIIKLDGCSHGDDHFFPGPTDIAWDLAGAMIEWNLDGDASDFLLSSYHRLSGDNPRPRILPYLLAYSVFRLAYSKMALSTVRGTPEESRLRKAYLHYRRLTQGLCELFTAKKLMRNPPMIATQERLRQLREAKVQADAVGWEAI